MNAEYKYQYTKKQIKDLSACRDRLVVIVVVLEMCVPMIISLLFALFLYIAKKGYVDIYSGDIYSWFGPITIGAWIIWPVVWILLLIYCFFFANVSESFRHSDSKQRILIDDKQAILTIETKNGTIEEKFYIKKIRQKKHYLIVYKNICNYVMIPIDVVNETNEKELAE